MPDWFISCTTEKREVSPKKSSLKNPFLSFRKSIKIFNKLPVTPICFNLKIRPLCQTLSKALEISRKIRLTSKQLSNDW